MSRSFGHLLILLSVSFVATACAFNFEVTSQRTALENQILGSYAELDQDLQMMASVRAVDEQGGVKEVGLTSLQAQAVRAKQNQEFNHDDLQELKAKQLIGESARGKVSLLPDGIRSQSSDAELNFARILVAEENEDRKVIWQRVLEQSPDLENDQLDIVIESFVERQRQEAKIGHWLEDNQGRWLQKSE